MGLTDVDRRFQLPTTPDSVADRFQAGVRALAVELSAAVEGEPVDLFTATQYLEQAVHVVVAGFDNQRATDPGQPDAADAGETADAPAADAGEAPKSSRRGTGTKNAATA